MYSVFLALILYSLKIIEVIWNLRRRYATAMPSLIPEQLLNLLHGPSESLIYLN
jgi:hypothetical protein